MSHIDHLIGKEVRVMDHPDVAITLRGVVGILIKKYVEPYPMFIIRRLMIPGLEWYQIEVEGSVYASTSMFREDVIIPVDNKGNDLEDWLE